MSYSNIRTLFVILIILSLWSCKSNDSDAIVENPDVQVLIDCNKNLTTAQVERHFTPPVAGRNYAYPNLAVHLALMPFDSANRSLLSSLHDFNWTAITVEKEGVDLNLVAFHTFNLVAFEMIYHDTIISNFHSNGLTIFKEKLNPNLYSQSIKYAEEVSKQLLAVAATDNYKETRNYTQFSPSEEEGKWKTTSPDYAPAIEPNWNKIRPFYLDSASQFTPERPTSFDVNKGSAFHSEATFVKNTVDSIDETKREIANFWDCNPNISHHHGHMMYFLQKISPGGHWIHIGLQVLEQKNVGLIEGAYNMALLATSINDAFIACWDEKYRSNYIRPETVIKKEIDKNWEPILQTPPFPEYPSGHSVVSATSATILTKIYGPSFAFTDSTEKAFGLPIRSFNSFREASDEAAISRLYGGIHFMPAIKNGVDMGNKVGEYIITKTMNQ